MELALMTEPQFGGTYDRLLAAARWSEDAGLVSFARSDHYLWPKDTDRGVTEAFTSFGGLARETSKIRLCILVSPITFRHPAVITKSAITIDEMSGGRLDLGVGTGWMEAEHERFGLDLPPIGERFRLLEEALEYVAAAVGDRTYEGETYRLTTPVRPLPENLNIVVGGSGPLRTPTLAGRFANEYNHFVTTPDVLAPKVAVMRSAATEAGRDPSSITISIMGPALVGRTDAEYREKLAAMAAERDREPEDLEQRWREAGIPLGTPAEAAETMVSLAEAGVDKYYVQHLDMGNLDDFKIAIEVLSG